MLKKTNFLYGLLATLFYFIPSVPFLHFLFNALGYNSVPLWQLCMLLIYPCLCPVLLGKLPTLPLSVVATALAGGLFTIALGQNAAGYWTYGIFCLFCCLLFSIKKIKAEKSNYFLPFTYPFLSFVLLIICYFIFSIQHDVQGQSLCLQFFLFSIILFLPIYYLRQYLDFVRQNTHSSAIMPKRRILGSGLFILLIFSGITIFLILSLSGLKLPWAGLLHSLAQNAANMILWFLRLINRIIKYFLGEPNLDATPDPLLSPEGGGSGGWMDTLLSVIIIGAGIAGIVWLLYNLFRNLLHFKRETAIDKKESLLFRKNTDRKQRLGYEKKEASSPSLHWLPRDNNEKIRKMFSRIIRKQSASLAPAEYASHLEDPQKQEQMKRLSFLYEKARYSSSMCTDEEVKEVRQYVKKLT